MHIESLRYYCLSKAGAVEETPFGPDTLVYKVDGKIFCLFSISDQPLSFNVKCDPDMAVELRIKYTCITPGYHMNKKHWNTVLINGQLKDSEIVSFIDISYSLVKSKKRV
jgi:predicted DNA-binding protein (MmcQ/YjbR family)